MKQTPLPLQFSGLSGSVKNVRKVNYEEYSSSCPRCGGEDRFRMFLNAKGKNKLLGWCRQCAYVYFPNNEKVSPEQFEQWRQEQIRIETKKKQEAEQALKVLRSEKIWERFYEQTGVLGRKFWTERGIREDWQDYWKLGLLQDYIVNNDYHSPAGTIPLWQPNWDVGNVKLRIINPKNQNDRYRSVYKTGMAHFFYAFPGLNVDTAILVEGEIKAMVVASMLGEKAQVIGLPSVTPEAQALTNLKKYGKLCLILDPDAQTEIGETGITPERRMVDILGRERCSIARLPGKVDDLILEHNFNVEAAIRVARAA